MIRVEEIHGKDTGIVFCTKTILYSGRSPYQEILIIQTSDYGRVLLLDGLVMTTEKDGFLYHEALVHPVFQYHPQPERVLIIGGGDGGALREVLRYDVKEVVVVEIDKEVVRVSKEFLPQMASAFEDPRVRLIFEDASRYVGLEKERFDIIIIDTSDPVGPATAFYKEEFFEQLKGLLNPKGLVGMQAESPIFHRERIRALYAFTDHTFGWVTPYMAPVPSYPGGMWLFFILSLEGLEAPSYRIPQGLRFYSRDVHDGLFRLPPFILEIFQGTPGP